MRKTLLAIGAIVSTLAWAGDLIPGYEPSGNQSLDTALYRLHNMYHAVDCKSEKDSYEYVVPLLSRALQEQPSLITDYIMPISMIKPISELHLKDIYEYQVEKVVAYKKVLEEKEGREIQFSKFQQLEYALNHAIFRRIFPGEPIPRDILQFSWEEKKDGTILREARWLSNYLGTYNGEETWLKRKKVFASWELKTTEDDQFIVSINDSEFGETLELILEKKVVEEGKPAQWSLIDKVANMEFHDYFTDLCSQP